MSDDELPDPDRAAILARRRRFIALAISGLATGGCKHRSAEPCLSISIPEDGGEGETEGESEPDASGPFVEDPGAPVEGSDETGEAETGEPAEANPQPCLKMRQAPHPCLMIMKKGT